MNERTDNYIVEDGTLTWINPLLKEFEVPEGVKIIKLVGRHINGTSKLERIDFSETVEEVGEQGMCDFNYLKDINLNKKLKRLKRFAFGSCKSLERINRYSSVR